MLEKEAELSRTKAELDDLEEYQVSVGSNVNCSSECY